MIEQRERIGRWAAIALRLIGSIAIGISPLGCARRAAPTVSPAARDGAAPGDVATEEGEVRIDGARMYASLVALASDELKGRATFSPEIDRAAELLATAYREAGVAPVGDDYRHGYAIVTGTEPKRPPVLRIRSRGHDQFIAATEFVPRSGSADGRVDAELVFVGYGVRSNERDGAPSYDDFAGIDVKGRIAIVLDGMPARPVADELVAAFRTRAEAHTARLARLREQGDRAAAEREQQQIRRELAGVIAPWWRGKTPPVAITKPAADPMVPLDIGSVLQQLVTEAETLPGPRFDPRAGRLPGKLARLAEAGAVGVIVVEGPRSHVDPALRESDPLPPKGGGLRGEPAKLPVVQLRWHEADAKMHIGGKKLSAVQAEIDRTLKPRSRVLATNTALIDVALVPIEQRAENVLARIDGSDLAHEIVVVGAHFDHIGVAGSGGCHARTRADGGADEICNGADDNGSGTVAVLELARAFAAAKLRPRRTIVFAHVSGEEIGLHGSKALAETPPKAAPFDRAGAKVVAMINLDMIGRLGDAGLAIGGIGSSSGWMPVLERIGDRGMKVIYERSITSRSDHANFYRKQVPVLFFFTGLHADYHAPGDELAGIARDGMTTITEIVAALVREVAAGASLPFTEPRSEDEGLTGALPGSNPATLERATTK